MIVSLEGLDKNDDIQNLVASENNFSFLRVKNITYFKYFQGAEFWNII